MKSILISAYESKGQQHLNSAYVRAFSKKGFYAVMSPVVEEDVSKENPDITVNKRMMQVAEEMSLKFDVLVLSGGRDINPTIYGQMNVASVSTDINRDLWEVSLLKAFQNKGKPIMGICRGFQLIGNIIGIPDFYQDIGKIDEHHSATDLSIDSRNEPLHSVFIHGDLSLFLKERLQNFKSRIMTNSFHHQGFVFAEKIKDFSRNFPLFEKECLKLGVKVLGHTNCCLEAFSHGKNVFAVQWHPEEYEDSAVISYFLEKFCN